MTQEKAKEILPYIQALAEGKTIQIYDECVGWADCKDPSFCMRAEYYRIKPEVETMSKSEFTARLQGKGPTLPSVVKVEDDEKKYRPFKDCDELITTFQKKIEKETELSNIVYPVLYKPCIWVRSKRCASEHLIVSFGTIKHCNVVEISNMNFTMKELFDSFEFLDDSPCGVLEE